MNAIINRSVPVVALGILLTSFSAQAVTLPAPGNYIDQFGSCMSVTSRDKDARMFTLGSGDVCKPGLTSAEGLEEKTYRCVAGGVYGYWGRLLGGSFSIQGDTQFVYDEAGQLYTQQTMKFEEALVLTPDTSGVCAGAPVLTTQRGR